MDEHDRPRGPEDQIRCAGQTTIVQSIAKTAGMQAPTDQHLRLRISLSDGGHVAPTLFGRQRIGPGRLPTRQGQAASLPRRR